MLIRLPASVGARVASALLVLGIVALGGAGATYLAMEAQADRVTVLTRATDGPRLVERLRAEVYAVVMESRGLYFARDARQAAAFADGLRRQAAQLENDWRNLRDLLPVEERTRAAALDRAAGDFIRLRIELARVGVEDGPQAADKLGNNDENRSTREAFSRGLDELARSTTAVVEQQEAETIAAGRRMSVTLLVTTVLAVSVVLGLVQWLVHRSVSQPLRRLAAALETMAEGRLNEVVLPPGGRGEVGGIATAAGVFLNKLRRNRELELAAQAEQAARNRRQQAMGRHTQEFGTSISGVMTTLSGAAEGMRRAAHDMAQAVDCTRDSATDTAAGAEQSSSNLASVAAATEELSASVGEIARQVAQAAEAAREAVSRARVTDATVQSLSDAAGQVGEVVRLISSIAGQTNLLALNATIEAARAGETGKGFAVVASEVKQLAAQTARATEQISTQMAAIQAATGDAVGAVREVGEAIGRMDEISSAIAAAIEEQGAATREIASKVQTVARQNDDASRAMRDVSGVAENAGTASRVVLTSAAEVAQVSSTLSEEVDQFLAAMRLDEGEQRSYERIAGGGTRATLRIQGKAEMSAVLADISRGGMALLCDAAAQPGTEAQVILPGASEPLSARVMRASQGLLALTFRQDPVTLERVGRVLELIEASTISTRAA